MGVPQIIMVCLYTINIGISMAKHGEPQDGIYNAWTSIFSSIVVMGLLWWGGFFG